MSANISRRARYGIFLYEYLVSETKIKKNIQACISPSMNRIRYRREIFVNNILEITQYASRSVLSIAFLDRKSIILCIITSFTNV